MTGFRRAGANTLLISLAGIIAVAGFGAGVWWSIGDSPKEPTYAGILAGPGATSRPRAFRVDPALGLGGSFSLIDHTGRAVTDATYRDHYKLVYFGYTYCPDVCPTDLGNVAVALDQLGSLAEQITPFFITVDPERDTPEILAGYVGLFHERLVGLTGTAEQVAAVAAAYRVFYGKPPAPAAASNTASAAAIPAVSPIGAASQDYLMDHTTFTYLVAPAGDVVVMFSHGIHPDKMTQEITDILRDE